MILKNLRFSDLKKIHPLFSAGYIFIPFSSSKTARTIVFGTKIPVFRHGIFTLFFIFF
ncbi:Uncharacterized protein dnm_011680 [Desulfonema magnum]|uniref:Uncharacterized protein n=1 Tax=Desulfonema magnum TaxID=45655 RepID=A0A975BH26_9BACT|nr:Uncharacterized protein dnm_011680 [Desulfonema magnum]